MKLPRAFALLLGLSAAGAVLTPPRVAYAEDEPKQEELPRRQANFAWDKALGNVRHTVLLGLRAKTIFGTLETIRTTSFLGGLGNLSGFGEREVIGNHSVLARAVYYRRFGRLDALFTVPTYIGGSLEYGGAFQEREDIDGGSLIAAGSVFLGVQTPLGPIFLGYGRNDLDLDSFYLTFGSLLRPIE